MSGYNIDRFVNLSEGERDELTCSCKEVVKLEHLTQHTTKYLRHVTSESSKYYPKFREKLDDEFGDNWHVIVGKRYEYDSFYSYKRAILMILSGGFKVEK
ncbi:unnamed protein product [Oppiella nova]|uniref:Dynein light chain n=1 Tax=Oppiella nova TaxID=334625 RepID=A0A7R9LVI8_9ACAR|nr:unnamed protein product [Oppiella nova]CAG2167386.1 unnamed protein product [Oppiella nova]